MKLSLLIVGFFTVITCLAQRQTKSSSEVYHELEKLKTLGNVLYLAAHPDDENTRVISYLSNERKVRTAYLSLTRGDGGQNLIGTEKGDALGLLRTQELLAARRLDGGEQFFTRALDFGYSKTPEETFSIWNKKEVLKDVVWIIRKFQPNVIITRFPTNAKTHGHHTASALLAEEAFIAAADSNQFKEQLKWVDTWQVTRLVHNASSWWYKNLAEEAKENPDYTTIDIGTYNSLLGKSYNEIASLSRSQHSSQGFGSAIQRGSQIEFFQHVKGQKAKNDLLDDIDLSWKKVGNENIERLIDSILNHFDHLHPDLSIPGLLDVYRLIDTLKNQSFEHQKQYKLNQLKDIIFNCAGLWFSANTSRKMATLVDTLNIDVSIINRSNYPIYLKRIFCENIDSTYHTSLEKNKKNEFNFQYIISNDTRLSNPYWLNEPHPKGMYKVIDQTEIGTPENKPSVEFIFELDFNGTILKQETPVQYKEIDRAKGEIIQPFAIVPDVTLNFSEEIILQQGEHPITIEVEIEAFKKSSATISMEYVDGWEIDPLHHLVFIKKGEKKKLTFSLTPNEKASSCELKLGCKTDFMTSSLGLQTIQYNHVPHQVLLPLATAKLVKLDVQKKGDKVGYVMGAGDKVPEALRQIGYNVTLLDPEKLNETDLSTFDAIIMGIRVYNTLEVLKKTNQYLLSYVKNGGNMIVQYNTSRGLKTSNFAPYPLELSWNRVTDETAKPTFLKPNHPLLNSPNKLTYVDFENWVQERGLYFADNWGKKFSPVISWHDKNEEPQNGSLLLAEYGKGSFIYTGISFFRQLPAGVPGAYRLLANLISYGK